MTYAEILSWMPKRKFFAATEIVVFDFELFIGGRRQLAIDLKIRDWSLGTLQEKLKKIGTKVVRHTRYVMFQMAEVAVPRVLFCEILERISRFTLVESTPGAG